MTEVTDAMRAAGMEAVESGSVSVAEIEQIFLAMEAARIPASAPKCDAPHCPVRRQRRHETLSAIPIPATGEVERDTAVRAWSAGARAVHDEWAKADEGERFYLSRDHEPDFTEAAHDYAAMPSQLKGNSRESHR